MPFGSHAELDKVERGYAIGTKGMLHFFGVYKSCHFMVGLVGGHTMYLIRRDRYFAQQYLLCHGIIALWVLWQHTALISPENLNLRPIDLASVWFAAKQAVEFLRR